MAEHIASSGNTNTSAGKCNKTGGQRENMAIKNMDELWKHTNHELKTISSASPSPIGQMSAVLVCKTCGKTLLDNISYKLADYKPTYYEDGL